MNEQPGISTSEERSDARAAAVVGAVAATNSAARSWRRVAIMFAGSWALTLVLLVATFLAQAELSRKNQETLKTAARSLAILEDATSPEKQAQQAAATQQALVTIDCNNREALQDLIDALQAHGVFGSPTITVSCAPDSTTTTTTPGG